MLKRIFDLVVAFMFICILSPIVILIAIAIKLDSKGSMFYLQERVGLNGKLFKLFKFRTMKPNADKSGLLTIGANDIRITRVGKILRNSKLDELPQLVNVLLGDMSIVGPRPEVKKYVELYTPEQKRVLTLQPGITDYASIQYVNESELLKKYENPEESYIKEIMPHKLELNLFYIDHRSFKTDLSIIFATLFRIIKNKPL
jgi:lipopolysaccharide/colanic/teichoic acid biosynthesis glycosyltransferase